MGTVVVACYPRLVIDFMNFGAAQSYVLTAVRGGRREKYLGWVLVRTSREGPLMTSTRMLSPLHAGLANAVIRAAHASLNESKLPFSTSVLPRPFVE